MSNYLGVDFKKNLRYNKTPERDDYMSYELEKIQKISVAYTRSDCAQFMVAHQMPYLSIIGDEIIYSAPEGRKATINKYLTDSRRFAFPYANIPSHREKRGKVLLNKVLLNYVNQIYEYDKPYIVLRDKMVNEQFVTQTSDSKQAIIVSRTLDPIFKGASFELNREELSQKLHENYTKLEGKKFIFSNGGRLISEEFLYNSGENNYIIVTSDGLHTTVTGLKVEEKDSLYSLKQLDFHVHRYNGFDLREIENYAQIISEPKIPRIYNLSIPKEEIIKAKTMARMKNR